MEKRVIAAIVLSIAILFAFRYYEERFITPPARPKVPPAAQAPVTTPAAKPEAAQTAPPSSTPLAELPAEEMVPSRQVTIESSRYRAVLDNRGGVLTHWELKQYKTGMDKPFDMVPEAHMKEGAYPGSLIFDDPAVTAFANSQNYAVEILPQGADAPRSAPATVVMRLRRGDLAIEKRYQFDDANYLVNFSATMQRGSQSLRGRLLIGQDIGPEPEHLLNAALPLSAVSDLGGKVQRDAPPKTEGEVKAIGGDVRWVGLEMQYFVQVAVPAQTLGSFSLERLPVKAVDLKGQQISRDLLRLLVPVDGSGTFRFYLGPKSQPELAAVPGTDLTGVIDYGTYLGIIVKPLLVALRFINQFIHNYGWSIIVLTFVLTLALFPFRLKQMVSMKKMQVLQPRIKEIQERYKKYKKTDPKRAEMNQEVMALYREHKVNPLGGCLPLLLQMPFLFAFYRLLSASIELRHAPFMLWIHDLSAKDPYYILPIVMGITMVISQKMTPMAPGSDPTQAKMMMIMPVVMMIFFLNVSSGLNLYFLCSNVFQIAFQKIAERWVGDQQPAPRAKSRG